MDSTYRKTLLKNALFERIREVTEYQVNIDNFRLALEEVGADPGLSQFRAQLQDLLKDSVFEQKKAKIMLTVIERQLNELGGGDVG